MSTCNLCQCKDGMGSLLFLGCDVIRVKCGSKMSNVILCGKVGTTTTFPFKL